VICGEEELAQWMYKLKNLITWDEKSVNL
jgi:hypothetical protein